MEIITLKKLTELPDAKHKHNIDVGFEKVGELLEEPKIGANFWVGHYWRTSTVKEIIDADTFKTCNSIYKIIRNPNTQ